MLKLAGSLPEAVPPQHSGNHRPLQEPRPAHVSLDIPPQSHSTSTSGNWDRGTDPTAFPTGTAKDETEALCVQKSTKKKKRQKPGKLRNWHILLRGGRCFTTRHLRRKCRHCPAVLGSILTWDPTAQSSSNTSPKLGTQPQTSLSFTNQVKPVTSHFQFIPRTPGQALGVNFLWLPRDSAQVGEMH